MLHAPPHSCAASPAQVMLQFETGAIAGRTPPAKPVPQWHSSPNSTPANVKPAAAQLPMHEVGVLPPRMSVSTSARTRDGMSVAHGRRVVQPTGDTGGRCVGVAEVEGCASEMEESEAEDVAGLAGVVAEALAEVGAT
jgi:hypothetical protein